MYKEAVPALFLRLTICARYKTKYCKYLHCVVDADRMEAYKWAQARHQTGEMLDTDNLDITDSNALSPADRIAPATEETCRDRVGHALLGRPN